jgi:hypothetical protein
MTTPEPDPTRRRNIILIAVLAVAVVAVGVVLGLTLGSEPTPPSTTQVAVGTTLPTSTTSLPPSTTTLPPTTTVPPSTTTTQPDEIGADVVVPVADDTSVEADDPNEFFGSSDELVAETNGPEIERSLLRFEVEEIPEDQVLGRVFLRMRVVDDGGTPVLAQVDGAWDETTVSWTNAPQVGADIAAVPDAPEGSYVRVDVTNFVQGPGTYEMYLVNGSDNDFVVASKETGDGPVLEIVFGTGESVMVGAGDIASCESGGDEVTASIIDAVAAEAAETVVFTTGDNAYESGTATEFADCYGPSWGRHIADTRPTPGSREYRTEGAAAYFEYFGEAAGNPGEGYYSYDFGGWHVVALNSLCSQVGGCEEGSPQLTWLHEDLAASDFACTLAYWHHPVFGSTSEGTNEELVPFWEVLTEADADVVVNGDHHFYERFAPQNASGQAADDGIVQFTVGTGGRSLAQIGPIADNSEVQYSESFGVLKLALNQAGLDWEFVPESGASFTDSGSIACH